MKVTKIIAVIILLAGTLYAETPVQDISVDSPLAISGTSENVLGTNKASKDILAYVVVFQDNLIFRDDHYFKSMELKAGATDTIIELRPPVHLDLSVPIRAKVTFAQFVDGSTWGDAASGLPMLLDRAEISHFLVRMTDAYTKNGQAGFLQLMNVTKEDNQQLPAVRTMAAHMVSLQSTTGMTGVLAEINGRISAAAKHDKMMKP